ncbi:SDR family NAD(P)-dependent oxidoreductase [Dapis sp. BLCC M229]|uniref:SDR family NAD(P)-dependent oxidoreductase n=1 Tax=Dapis sp. BLCC M229 TaxID=3400188 RepID=UPI003CEB3463
MNSNQGGSLARIAIVGVSCRFPGADTKEEFWQLLKEGRDSMQNLPSKRWGNLFNSLSSETDLSIQRGGFLTDIDLFDPSFFRITSKEAQLIDPQQRLLLELSWEAMEDAGYASDTLKGKSVGVYVGVCHYDYRSLLEKGLNTAEIAQIATGTAPATFANRLSYFYDFHGPSLTVDTACSSSLVAMYEAVNAIRRGQCQTALVGGVNLICSPVNSQVYSAAGMLSPDGVCRVFDAGANGFVRGEGGAVVVIKDYQKALTDGDSIYGVVRSVAVNHGGQASSFTAPNPQAQAELLEQAYREANIDIESVGYVEAHGTGTSLGDPIEVEALNEAFKRLSSSGKLPANSCGLASVKTNIGHLEGAAGLAGLIKVLLCMKYATLPSSLNYHQINPDIELQEGPFFVVDKLQSWEVKIDREGKPYPLRAGLSSFGFGGTNAHVVLEEGINKKEERRKDKEPSVHILTLSAKTETALSELVNRYQKYLNTNLESELADICYTVNSGRVHFNHRLAAIASNKQELTEKLKEYQAGEATVGVFTGKLPERIRKPKIAFLFTGQGSQYVNMGKQLYQTQPVFREVLDRCDAILSSQIECSLLDVLYTEAQDSSLLNQTAYTQPALFAIEYALCKLWESWGIKPNVVMGHSVGEYVAACVAGVFSLEEGLKLIAARGRLMQQLPAGGEMVSVMASHSKVRSFLEPHKEIAIAAINGPESTVISGNSEGVRAVVSSLESAGIKTKELQVSHAFHSPLMEPMLAEFEAVAKQVTYNQPRIPLISNVSGQKVGAEITTAKYWVNHVRQPVKFAQSMETLHEKGYEIFLEIGPKPILLGMGRGCLPEDVGVCLPSLRPGINEWQQMLLSLGKLYVQGAKVNWLGLQNNHNPQKVALPTYPFERQRYWVETSQDSKDVLGDRQQFKNIHPLLGKKINIAGKQQIFESFIEAENPAYLSHHQVFGTALFPTTAYLEIALEAGKNQYNTPHLAVKNLSIERGLVLPEEEWKIVQTILKPLDNQTYQFQLFTTTQQEKLDERQWILHATAEIQPVGNDYTIANFDREKHLLKCTQTIEIKEYYQKFQQLGINYGSSFQGIQQLWKGEGETIAKVSLPKEIAAEITEYNIHPALLDSALQVIFNALPESTNGDRTYLPVGIDRFQTYSTSGLSLWAYASVESLENLSSKEHSGIWKANVTLSSESGEIIAEIFGLRLKQGSPETLLGSQEKSIANWLYEVEWRNQGPLDELPPKEPTPKNWLILADKPGIAQQLVSKFQSVGDVCILIFAGEKYQQISPEEFTINPEKLSDFEQLITTISAKAQSIDGVVQCWTTEVRDEEKIEELSRLGCESTLLLLQTLLKGSLSQIPRLWLVTSGAQLVPASHPVIPGVALSSVWGMGKVISLEHPELNCACIDLDPQETIENRANTLFNEVCLDDKEDQVAWRGDSRYVARLVASNHWQPKQDTDTSTQKSLSLRQDASYLITGGMGGLGLLIARWLVSKGAKHLVLIGRSSPTEAILKTIKELETEGTSVMVEKADVSDKQSMAGLLSKFDNSSFPLAGVIHLAGVLSDGMIQNQSWSSFEKVMAPKVQGAWHLHELTKNLPLEFFVLFSSVTSLFGNPGQINYAAANGFLDGLANYRRTLGLPGLSIHWSAISQVGMAAEGGIDVRLQQKGMGSISPNQLLESLEVLMSGKVSSETRSDVAAVGVVPIDWSMWQERVAKWKFLADWQEKFATVYETSKSEFILKLQATSPKERFSLLVVYLRRQVALVLGINDIESISLETGFFDLGMDSLTSMELRNKLQTSLDFSLPSTLAFEYPNIQALAYYLEENIIPSLDSTKVESEIPDATISPPSVELKLSESSEPIAIIGIGCRFPGGVDSVESYWELLKQGKDVRTEIPQDRWDIDFYYDPNPNVPGKMYVRQGYFLEQPIDQFEPDFFGISGAEAAKMEPSQRLLLEVTWEALENAGISPKSLKNTNTGVYVGQMYNDYGITAAKSLPENLADFYLTTGTVISISAGRIAYLLGLQGPTLCLDTSCSSSLVTLHLACQSLRSRESNLALVGGVNLMLHPNTTHALCQGGALSPDSLCKTFDASANGYARGEGCGMVVLKRLQDALVDGDRILAVVKSSAVNHDGPSSGLTVPNQQAQKKLILQALDNAKVDPLDIDYVECHGTGTSLGDPLEVRALNQVYCQGRSKENALLLGAVKSNIGHLEAAAGVAGLIKTVLALYNQEIPKNLHFNEPNPKIEWEEMPVKVLTKLLPWEKRDKSRLAAISGFGMSGTNAHVILEEAPIQVKNLDSEEELERSLNLLTLSATTQTAMSELVSSYKNHIEAHPELTIGDICYTANTGRTHFNHRVAVVTSNQEELATQLLNYKQGQKVPGIFSGEVPNNITAPKIAFLFTGQGSQYVDMARTLYEQAPVFREVIDRCDTFLREELEYLLVGAWLSTPNGVIYNTSDSTSSLLDQTAYTQPALFAIEYALTKLWESWGITPDIVMGHSVGEYVAACVAGVFSLEDALKLIAARGRLMQKLPAGGGMVSVMASESKVRTFLASYKEIAIAAINGPESTVISGNLEELKAIVSSLESAEIKTKQLQVSHAFHSPLMEPMLASFEEVANRLTYNQPTIPVISNVTGMKADDSMTTAQYWVNHVRQPVRFVQGMDTLNKLGYEIFLEVGPKPILLGMGRECLLGTKGKKFWLPSLRPGKQDWLQILQSLAQLYVQGINVDWLGFDKYYPRQKVVLPTYPWQRERYWITGIQKHKQSRASIRQETQEERQIQTNRKRSERVKIRLSNLDLASVPKAFLRKERPKRELLQLTVKSTEEKINVQPPVDAANFELSAIRKDVNFDRIKDTLKQQLADALYVDISKIAEDKKFIDLGLDSILGVEWINTINQNYGLDIKATKLYDYPTLLEFAEYIAQVLSSQEKTPAFPGKKLNTQLNLSQIKETLKQQLADVLYVDLSKIVEDKKFIDLGLDSILGVEWINTINQNYGLDIKATKLYDYPTLLEFAEYIAQVLSSQEKTPAFPGKKLNTQLNLSQIKETLKQQLADVLYVDLSKIVEDKKFIDLGLDSILGVEWINTINQNYGLDIKATKLDNHTTLLEFAEYIAQEISDTSLGLVSEQPERLLEGKEREKDKVLPSLSVYQESQVDSQENWMEEFNSILDRVAKKELPIKIANQMINKLKQKAKNSE